MVEGRSCSTYKSLESLQISSLVEWSISAIGGLQITLSSRDQINCRDKERCTLQLCYLLTSFGYEQGRSINQSEATLHMYDIMFIQHWTDKSTLSCHAARLSLCPCISLLLKAESFELCPQIFFRQLSDNLIPCTRVAEVTCWPFFRAEFVEHCCSGYSHSKLTGETVQRNKGGKGRTAETMRGRNVNNLPHCATASFIPIFGSSHSKRCCNLPVQ
jgi:hypothetical protein